MKTLTFDIETTGLNAWFGDRITCICAKSSDNDTFSCSLQDEQQIITNFLKWCKRFKDHTLVTHNGKRFDVPFIQTRLALAKVLNHQLLEFKQYDTIEFAGKYISLADYCTIYGLSGKLGTGKGAVDLWNSKKYTELKEYCMMDVIMTEKVMLHQLKYSTPGLTGSTIAHEQQQSCCPPMRQKQTRRSY